MGAKADHGVREIEELWESGELKGRVVRVISQGGNWCGRHGVVTYLVKGSDILPPMVCLDREISHIRYWPIDELEVLP